MTALALSRLPPFPASIGRAVRPRAVHWLSLLVVLAGIALPDCCMFGCHMFAAGTEEFGFICRAHS